MNSEDHLLLLGWPAVVRQEIRAGDRGGLQVKIMYQPCEGSVPNVLFKLLNCSVCAAIMYFVLALSFVCICLCFYHIDGQDN